jgi:ribosomal protein L14
MYPALILTIKKNFYRKNGIFIKFNKNRVLLINDQLKFLGTRYKGPISKEIYKYKKKILKIISLAKKIL